MCKCIRTRLRSARACERICADIHPSCAHVHRLFRKLRRQYHSTHPPIGCLFHDIYRIHAYTMRINMRATTCTPYMNIITPDNFAYANTCTDSNICTHTVNQVRNSPSRSTVTISSRTWGTTTSRCRCCAAGAPVSLRLAVWWL